MKTLKPTLILSFTLLVVMLGYGMVLPVMPFYIEKLGAGGRELGWLMGAYSLMQLIFASLWGILSDRVGRKPVLTLGVLGYAVTLFMFGLATEFWMLFLARLLSGILSSATMPTAMAFIGDSAPEKERSGSMGQLGAAMGVGIVLGPLIGGLLSANSLSLPFFIGAGMAFGAFLLVIFLLPESHRPQAERERAAGTASSAFRIGNLLQIGNSLSLRDTLRRTLLNPAGMLLLLVFIMSFGLTSFQGITGLYVVDKFDFNTKQVGAIWMVMGAVLILVQGLLTGPLTRRFGELPLISAGLAGGAIGFLGMSLAVDVLSTLLAVGLFTAALALVGPTLNAFLSNFAGEQQGTVMGLNSAASSMGRVVGPLWAGYLYEVDIDYPYYSGSGALVLSLAVCYAVMRAARRAPQPLPAEGSALH
jgi:DHA1 family multidrug resistance protein-like MFS transporter